MGWVDGRINGEMEGGRRGPARPLTQTRAALAAVIDYEETDKKKNHTQRHYNKERGEIDK